MFFLLSLFLAQPVYSIPNWFKEGTYLKYAARMPEHPDRHGVNVFPVWPQLLPRDAYSKIKEAYEGTSNLIKMDNNSIVPLLVRGDSYLTFEVLNVTNKTALVRVTLEMDNVSVRPGVTLPRLILSRVLRLNLSDMVYYEEDGTPIGPPTFFIDPASLPKKGDYLLTPAFMKKYDLKGDDIVVTNVSFTWMEDKILHTHYRDFIPPYLFVESEGAYVIDDLTRGDGHTIITELIYEPDTGVLIATIFTDMTSELTSLGVIGAIALDRVNSRKLHKLIDEGKADKEWYAQGFNIYDTNIKFPDYGSTQSPAVPMKYFFALSLLVLIIIFVRNERRWRR